MLGKNRYTNQYLKDYVPSLNITGPETSSDVRVCMSPVCIATGATGTSMTHKLKTTKRSSSRVSTTIQVYRWATKHTGSKMTISLSLRELKEGFLADLTGAMKCYEVKEEFGLIDDSFCCYQKEILDALSISK